MIGGEDGKWRFSKTWEGGFFLGRASENFFRAGRGSFFGHASLLGDRFLFGADGFLHGAYRFP